MDQPIIDRGQLGWLRVDRARWRGCLDNLHNEAHEGRWPASCGLVGDVFGRLDRRDGGILVRVLSGKLIEPMKSSGSPR